VSVAEDLLWSGRNRHGAMANDWSLVIMGGISGGLLGILLFDGFIWMVIGLVVGVIIGLFGTYRQDEE
jgi:uncharacterized membrane protein YjjP (DUF1212 family)